MATHSGPLATIRCEPRQARKGAAAAARLERRGVAGLGCHPSIPSVIGEVSERLKEHAWKVCVRLKRTEGSNPSLSAKMPCNHLKYKNIIYIRSIPCTITGTNLVPMIPNAAPLRSSESDLDRFAIPRCLGFDFDHKQPATSSAR